MAFEGWQTQERETAGWIDDGEGWKRDSGAQHATRPIPLNTDALFGQDEQAKSTGIWVTGLTLATLTTPRIKLCHETVLMAG